MALSSDASRLNMRRCSMLLPPPQAEAQKTPNPVPSSGVGGDRTERLQFGYHSLAASRAAAGGRPPPHPHTSPHG